EWARAALGADSAALRALEGRPVGAVLEEQQLDAAVRGGLQCRRPPARRARAAAGFLTPALGRLLLPLGMRVLEDRSSRIEQLGRSRMCLGVRPADDRVFD